MDLDYKKAGSGEAEEGVFGDVDVAFGEGASEGDVFDGGTAAESDVGFSGS